MSLKEKLQAAKPREVTVNIEGDEFLVIGVSRSAKNKIVEQCTDDNGKMDVSQFEATILAACVCDPQTRVPVMPEPLEWDVPSHIAGPLVEASMNCCGFSKEEKDKAKK